MSTQVRGKARGGKSPAGRREESSTDDKRQELIAKAAYFRAEKRGFEPGHELDDWLAGEAEIANDRSMPIAVQ